MSGFDVRFEISARKFPLNHAIIFVDNNQIQQKITYKELHETVVNLTQCLKNYITTKHSCIGVLFASNLYLSAVILSIHKLDSAFYCIDPNTTDISVTFLSTIGIKYILTNNYIGSFLHKNATKLYLIDNFNIEIWQINDSEQPKECKDISYVVRTSGTTGEQKIVKVFHDCIYSNIESLREIFAINEKDVIYFGTPVTFDPFIIEIMLALTTGATLFIVTQQLKNNKLILLETLFSKNPGITVLQIPPSIFLSYPEKYIDLILSGKTNLRILALGGEHFPDKILNYPNKSIRLFNLYGITEVSCWASVEEIKTQKNVSLGIPFHDTIFQIRDDTNKIIEKGEGQLFIGSTTRICLINNEIKPHNNKTIFRPTGDLVKYDEKLNKYFYICRKNDVIKRFGIKINLIEIDKLIYQTTQLVSISIWDESISKLILFIILQETDQIIKDRIIDKLRIKLLHNLPAHSNPDYIEIIPSIPVTINGKLDRKSLLEISNFNSINTRTPKEIFQKLYSKYFGLSSFQIEAQKSQSFFTLGGNSILAIQIISEFDSFVVKNNYSANLMALLLDPNKCFSNYVSFIDENSTTSFEDLEIPTSSKQRKLSNVEQLLNTNNLKLEVQWKYDLKACVDCTPIVFNHRSYGTVIASGSHANIFAILNRDGKLISQTIFQDAIEGTACISICQNFAIIGCNDNNIYCIEIKSGNICWKFQTGSSNKTTPVLCCDDLKRIIFGSYDQFIYCLNIQDASLFWKLQINESIKSSAIVYNDNCYVATIQGSYYCISVEKGEIIWEFKTNKPVFGSPCLIKQENIILWADVKGNVNCFDCINGNKIWTFEVHNCIYSSLVEKNQRILFNCFDHNIYCIECTRKGFQLIFQINIRAQISSTPCIFMLNNNDYFTVANNKGILFVFEFQTGILQQQIELPGEVFSSPVVFDNNIFVGCRDNYLYCIKINKL